MFQAWCVLSFPWRKAWHTQRSSGQALWRGGWAVCVQGLFGMAMMPLALLGWLLALLLNACSPQRGLDAAEKAWGQGLFSNAMLERTRVALPGGHLLAAIHRVNGGRPFVCQQVIYPGKGTMDARTFQHELTHVWQHTWMGPWYMVLALAAQWRAGWQAWRREGRFNDAAAYAFDHQSLSQCTGHRYAFNPEQQAEMVATYAESLSGQCRVCPEVQGHLARLVPRFLGLT